ncbi:hypothetical protein JCM6882_004150 [Rhodosporidiobolus microsporus]
MPLPLNYLATFADTVVPGIALTEQADATRSSKDEVLVLTGAPALATYALVSLHFFHSERRAVPAFLQKLLTIEHRLAAVPVEMRLVTRLSKTQAKGFFQDLILPIERKVNLGRQTGWDEDQRIVTTGNGARKTRLIDFLCSTTVVPRSQPTTPALYTTLELHVPAAAAYLPPNDPAWLVVDSGIHLAHHYLHRLSRRAPRGRCLEREEDGGVLFALHAIVALFHSCLHTKKTWKLDDAAAWHDFAAMAQEIPELAEEVVETVEWLKKAERGRWLQELAKEGAWYERKKERNYPFPTPEEVAAVAPHYEASLTFLAKHYESLASVKPVEQHSLARFTPSSRRQRHRVFA